MIWLIVLLVIAKTNSLYFSTKTSYKTVANEDSTIIFPPSHQIIYVRYLGRHGSRLPSKKDVAKIRSVIGRVTEFANNTNILDHLLKFPLDEKMDKKLSLVGIQEMYELGNRYRKRLENMLASPCFSVKRIKFSSTCRGRSVRSMLSFMGGMFPTNTNSTELPQVKARCLLNDTTYRFFDFCKAYKDIIDNKKMHKKQGDIFMASPVMINIARSVSEKLGMDTVNHLTPEEVKSLYLICAYNISIYHGAIDTGACRLFDMDGLKAYAYLLDIITFYKRANSIRVNIEMSCLLFSEIYQSVVESLDSCPNNFSCFTQPKGDFGFSHAETLIPILGFLGLLGSGDEDYLITNESLLVNADNYQRLKNDRIFNGGYFSPMGGNIVLAVGCPTDGIDQGVVMALLNETPIRLPCCGDSILYNNSSYPVCSRKQFITCFQKYVDKCDFNETCSKEITS